ncbi:MAG: DUF4157 domain-containing protein [Chitinophagaceae bacterium]|nr:DUF4157 domain-containing protein [Chitinophagaceae bacterium]
MKNYSIHIKENSWLAKLGAIKLKHANCAMVIGNTIHLYQIPKSEFIQNLSLFRHEIEHIKQWKRIGFMLFPIQYVWYSFKYGYYNNPFEVEARLAESDIDLLKWVKII